MYFVAVHLWQSTLFLAAAWLLTLACRRNAAAVRYWIWLAAAVKFLIPLALLQWLGDYIGRTLPDPRPIDSTLLDAAGAVFVPSMPYVAAIPDAAWFQIQSALAVIWMLGTALVLLRWFLQWHRVRSALAFVPRTSLDLSVPVCVTSSDLAPGVFGVFRPVLILPRAVMETLEPRELQAVLAHELCHIRRRDNFTAAVQRCVEAVFWFHPLVWRIGSNLLRERETACDESVVEQGHERLTYAQSILNVCRLTVAGTFSGVAASTGGDLAQRMSSIMSERAVRPLGHGRCALLLTAATLVWIAPVAAGVLGGAISEAAQSAPLTFDTVVLTPSAAGQRSRSRFDCDARRLVLRNVSLRQVIAAAYPWSHVAGDPEILDRIRYDIDAHWHESGGTSERNVHRELLERLLQNHFNVQLYIGDRCHLRCR